MAMKTIVKIHNKDYDLSYNAMRLYFIDAAIWAVKNCKSYRSFKIQEIGDTIQVCNFVFADKNDALLFRLKWS
jgi:hypothetical protein